MKKKFLNQFYIYLNFFNSKVSILIYFLFQLSLHSYKLKTFHMLFYTHNFITVLTLLFYIFNTMKTLLIIFFAYFFYPSFKTQLKAFYYKFPIVF